MKEICKTCTGRYEGAKCGRCADFYLSQYEKIEEPPPEKPVVDGWEFNEYRLPKKGESFFYETTRKIGKAQFDFEDGRKWIATPVPQPRLIECEIRQDMHGRWVYANRLGEGYCDVMLHKAPTFGAVGYKYYDGSNRSMVAVRRYRNSGKYSNPVGERFDIIRATHVLFEAKS